MSVPVVVVWVGCAALLHTLVWSVPNAIPAQELVSLCEAFACIVRSAKAARQLVQQAAMPKPVAGYMHCSSTNRHICTAALLCACCTAQAACSCLLHPLLLYVQSAADKIPWKLLLSKRAVWALILSHFCHNWGTFILLTWMPTYYNQVHPACRCYMPISDGFVRVTRSFALAAWAGIVPHRNATQKGSPPLALRLRHAATLQHAQRPPVLHQADLLCMRSCLAISVICVTLQGL